MRLPHRRVVDFEDVDILVLPALLPVFVHADDGILPPVDPRLLAGGGFFNAQFRAAGLDGLGHPAPRLHLGNQFPSPPGNQLRQVFHQVGAAPRIHHFGNAGFLLNNQLGVAGDAGGGFARQGDGFVQRIGVQGLGAAEHRRERLDGGAHHIVVGLLRRERPAGSLAVGAQHGTLRVSRVELADDFRPDQAGGAQFGDFHIEVHADAPEEGEARRELVDAQPGFDGGADVFLAVGEGVGQFQRGIRPRLLHVVAGDGDRVEARQMFGAVGDDVADDPHARRGGVDVGVAHHEFLEDVVLNRARKLRLLHALLLGGDDVTRQHRQHRAVHRHGNGNFVQRDAREEDFHILHRIHRHPGLAYIPGDSGMV